MSDPEKQTTEPDSLLSDDASECEASIKQGAITQGSLSEQNRHPDKRGVSRREFVAGTAGAAVLLGVGGVAVLTPTDPEVLRPPGGQDEEHFIGLCIRCDRCRSACPRNAIEVSGIEAGLINMRSPRLDYRSGRITSGYEALRSYDDPYEGVLAAVGGGFCDFCGLCIANCPTGALQEFDPTAEWIGEAVVIPDLCIAFEKIGGCRKCVDYCAFNAIVLDDEMRPVVEPQKCNGCGMCESICPTASFRTLGGLTKRGINIEPNNQGRPQ